MKEAPIYNIAIADNQPVVVQGLLSIFNTDSKCNVLGVVSNSSDLRNMVENNDQINTIFLDLKLPATNIYRLIKDLVVVHQNVKLIAFTNFTMPKLVQDVMEFGIHAYLSKTATVAEIKESIKRVHNGEQFICASVYQSSKSPTKKAFKLPVEIDEDFVRFSELTEREMDVVILLSRGYTNKEMATKLNLSKYTIETHRKNLMKKLKLKTSGQLIYFAAQQGLV